MKKLVLAISLFVTIVANCDSAKACTAAVVAAKASSEGGTILWKNRDSAFHSTIIQYIESEKYSYLGVSGKFQVSMNPSLNCSFYFSLFL